MDLSSGIDLSAPVFYVAVYDATERPEVFPNEASAQSWVGENRCGWKVCSEMVTQRGQARWAFNNLVQQARAGGWYRPGPLPVPETAGAPDSEYISVGVAHAGLTAYVYVDQSDADAITSLAGFSPHAPAGFTLHRVRMRTATPETRP